MFIAVSCDCANDDHRRAVTRLLEQYGFRQVQESLFESTSLNESLLARLKRDIDRLTDSYDSLRLYQYPLGETLVITSLKEKKWRRYTIRTTSG